MNTPRKVIFGTIYGLVGGLVFSIAAWGFNAFLLSRASLAYPYLAFMLGLLPVMLTGGLAGFLTIQFENTLLGAITWMVAGILIAVIGIWVPLGLTPEIIPLLKPVLKGWQAFNWQDAYTFLIFSSAIVGAVSFLIAGLLESVLIDQAAYSPYNGAIVAPLLVCALIAGVFGGVIDNMTNVRFRDYALGLDRLFTFALENHGKSVDPKLARQMHMSAVSTVADKLTDERSLYYFSFNETADQGQILVDFSGEWVLCDMFSGQPAFCRAAEPPTQ